MAHLTQDDGFHEIQLNGKQLVFLFMAATVVSVVIFLCGVLVGRGVRAERSAAADGTATSEGAMADIAPAATAGATSLPVPSGSDPTTAAPPPTVDDLTYFKRLEQPNQPPEKLKPAPPSPAPPAAREPVPPAVARELPPPAAKEIPPAAKEMPPAAKGPTPQGPAGPVAPVPPLVGPGYAVQVAALNVRSEADAIARRLASKGYAAYVVSPANGTPSVYRVRVGSFKTKREADTMAAKLQKEEQFKPWVTR